MFLMLKIQVKLCYTCTRPRIIQWDGSCLKSVAYMVTCTYSLCVEPHLNTIVLASSSCGCLPPSWLSYITCTQVVCCLQRKTAVLFYSMCQTVAYLGSMVHTARNRLHCLAMSVALLGWAVCVTL